MKRKIFSVLAGCFCGLIALVSYVDNSLNDRSILDNDNLHPEVLAQAGTTGSGGGGETPDGKTYLKSGTCECPNGQGNGGTLYCNGKEGPQSCTEDWEQCFKDSKYSKPCGYLK